MAERAAEDEQAASNAAADDTATLTAILERLTAQRRALRGMDLLLGGGGPAKRAWQQQIQAQRDRLQVLADGLDVPGARNLDVAGGVVSTLIDQTRALDDIAQASLRATKRHQQAAGYGLLERLEALRRELDAVTGRFVAQAATAEVDLPAALATPSPMGCANPDEHDVLAQLALALELLERADRELEPVGRNKP